MFHGGGADLFALAPPKIKPSVERNEVRSSLKFTAFFGFVFLFEINTSAI